MVYLIHFTKKLHHAGHYLGYTTDFESRIERHRSGQGARLLQVLNQQGIAWDVVRIWPDGTSEFESILKKHLKHTPRLCPICNPESKSGFLQNSEIVWQTSLQKHDF